MIYALDTNTVSYLLNKDKQVENRIKQAVDTGNEYIIPPMVYYEVKRWLVVKKAFSKLSNFSILCHFTNEITMNESCWEKAIDIYAEQTRNGTPIEDGDIFIAAYCIVNDYTLVTNDIRHFQRIDGLKIVNWKD